jgi:hypothetical protein
LIVFSQKKKLFIKIQDTSKFKYVLLDSLAKNLSKYDSLLIMTEGYFYFDFEVCALFSSELEKGNSIANIHPFWITFERSLFTLDRKKFSPKNWDGKKIRVKGRLDINQHGHMGNYEATVTDVYYIEEL